MDFNIADCFRAAFEYLLAKKGYGAQAAITRKTGVQKSYINNILKGRSPGDEERRRVIANALDIKYDDMISLGKSILSGENPANLTFPTLESDAGLKFITTNWHQLPNSGRKKIIDLVEEYSGPSFLYSGEIQQYKKHSEERGYYIWKKVCDDSGLSAIYEHSKRLEIIENYKIQKFSDFSLFQQLNKYVECLILKIKNNINQ